MSVEVWKPIPGFPGYEASSLGRLKGRYIKADGVLRQYKHKASGYWYCKLSLNNKPKFMLIHRAVCMAFHGLPPEGKPCALHGDDIREHNTPDNLRWGTHQENIAERDSKRREKISCES